MADSVFCFFIDSANEECLRRDCMAKWLPLQRKAVKLFISAQRDFIFALQLIRMIVWYIGVYARALQNGLKMLMVEIKEDCVLFI